MVKAVVSGDRSRQAFGQPLENAPLQGEHQRRGVGVGQRLPERVRVADRTRGGLLRISFIQPSEEPRNAGNAAEDLELPQSLDDLIRRLEAATRRRNEDQPGAAVRVARGEGDRRWTAR